MTTLILVSGSRKATMRRHGATIRQGLLAAAAEHLNGSYTLWHGAAAGVDQIAATIAGQLGWHVEAIPANWAAPCRPACSPRHRRIRLDGSTYCPAVGLYRNQDLVDKVAAGLPNAVACAWPRLDSRGTYDAIRRARAAGITVHTHQLGTPQSTLTRKA